MNVNVRPYYAEGSKTLGFEIAEQLGFELPDRVVVPVASGSLFTRIARGLDEWRSVGLIEGDLPAMNGAQAQGCSPVASAFAAGQDRCRPVRPDTIAKSLAIGDPADGPYAVEPARRSGGSVDSVSDEEIREGIRLLAETTGIFTETAGGVTTAVLRELAERGEIGSDERVVLVITGDGLKTLDAVRGTFEMHEVDPTIESVTDTVETEQVAAGGCLNSRPMSVTVKIPTQLRSVTGGEGEPRSRARLWARCSTASTSASKACGSGSRRTVTCAASSTST